MRRHAALLGILLLLALPAVAVTGCTSNGGEEFAAPADLPAETTSTAVFYSTGRSLVTEWIVVDKESAYEATLETLLNADPKENTGIAIVQTTAPFNAVEFDAKTGVLTIDWTADILAFEAEPAEERLALASILMTMGQFPEVEKVRFTVDGKDSGTVEGKDVVKFWGDVSLIDQPWDALRPPAPEKGSEETSAAGTSS